MYKELNTTLPFLQSKIFSWPLLGSSWPYCHWHVHEHLGWWVLWGGDCAAAEWGDLRVLHFMVHASPLSLADFHIKWGPPFSYTRVDFTAPSLIWPYKVQEGLATYLVTSVPQNTYPHICCTLSMDCWCHDTTLHWSHMEPDLRWVWASGSCCIIN